MQRLHGEGISMAASNWVPAAAVAVALGECSVRMHLSSHEMGDAGSCMNSRCRLEDGPGQNFSANRRSPASRRMGVRGRGKADDTRIEDDCDLYSRDQTLS
jgi:hypothetical protein